MAMERGTGGGGPPRQTPVAPTGPNYPWAGYGYGQQQPRAPWWAGMPGGMGGGRSTPEGPTWAGAIPEWSPLPWTAWEQTPWANVPKDKSREAQAWMNVMMPWLQQQSQQQQWGQEFGQRQKEQEWSQGFQGQQFDWQKKIDEWSQGFQRQQMEEQAAVAREEASLATFGRRWRPQSRWY